MSMSIRNTSRGQYQDSLLVLASAVGRGGFVLALPTTAAGALRQRFVNGHFVLNVLFLFRLKAWSWVGREDE